MQVVVMRAFRDVNSTASPVCCTEVGRTPVFTPAPNAVTTIDTALAVRKDVVPDPVNNTVTFDSLALSVLAPNVPVPAFDGGRHDRGDFGIPSAVVYQLRRRRLPGPHGRRRHPGRRRHRARRDPARSSRP